MRVHKSPGKGYYARVGDFFGPLRETSSAAIKGLDEELEGFHPLSQTYLPTSNGGLIHIFQVPSHGWNATFIGYKQSPQGIVAQAKTLGVAKQKSQEWADKNAGGLQL